MISLLVIVFILQICIHLLWTLYNKFPTSTSKSVQESNTLRAEVLRLKREMNATSSQDQFAKWAKLRRQHDKAVGQYDEKTNSLKAFRDIFNQAVTVARWLGTNGLRFFLQFWFAKRPMFWMPRGWVPGYVEFLLSFPRAPRGSVSIQVWGIACGTVMHLVGAAGAAGWFLAQKRTEQEGRGKQKVGMGMGKAEGKKEL
ncbi:MAG: hypothetical protein LQ343_003661 [Gyalolechia ehrenbergii]|nr:MAG: hypothetical protein LQ343_003661 [Gyalolechia ehrenbergii]